MAYFKYFPRMKYDIRGEEGNIRFDRVTNIIARVLMKCTAWTTSSNDNKDFVKSASYFTKHLIQDGERMDTLAHKYYNDSTLHWVLAYSNSTDITNPYYDWPMSQYTLVQFAKKKYDDDLYGTHHWENADGYEVDETAPGATIVTNFAYEETLNDAKRPINILKPEYVGSVVKEFKHLMTL